MSVGTIVQVDAEELSPPVREHLCRELATFGLAGPDVGGCEVHVERGNARNGRPLLTVRIELRHLGCLLAESQEGEYLFSTFRYTCAALRRRLEGSRRLARRRRAMVPLGGLAASSA